MGAVRTGLTFLLLAAGAGASRASAPDTLGLSTPLSSDYLTAPVFYELHSGEARATDLALLRRGLVRLPLYQPVDISGFDWSQNSGTDGTWWMQMQEMRFLLPAIASDAAGDRALAKDYLVRWFMVHMIPEPRIRHWGEPMAVAYRAMVFVYYLKRESGRSDPDPDVVGVLHAAILEHQNYLAGPGDFDVNSNKAFIDALGLFETTRVFANPRAATSALARLQATVRQAVSPYGVEMEGSPTYDFVVMRWIDQTADYFESLPRVPRAVVNELAACSQRMHDAAYFLQDHDGGIPQVGDGDSVTVATFGANYRVEAAPSAATTLYDPGAGYAIYKGCAARGDHRYVVFRNPSGAAEMALHSHDDLLSVYFSHAGEIILGDAGRYSYAPGPQRDYFLSQRAHNTIVVSASLTEPPRLLGTRLARSVEDRSTAGARRWFASLMTAGSECRRTVLVTDRANVVSVVDSIFPRSEGAAPEELAWVWNVGHDVTETKASRSEGRGLGEWTLATRRGQHVRLAVVVTESGAPTSCDVDLIRGQQNPLMGWCSPRWGMMCPTTAIVIRAGRDRLLVVRTDIEVIKGRASSGE